MPTPPWKQNSSDSGFPIPPRSNNYGIHPKASNYVWNNPSNNHTLGLGVQSANFGVTDHRLDTQHHGFSVSDKNNIGMMGNEVNRVSSGSMLGVQVQGSIFHGRNSGIPDDPPVFDGQRGMPIDSSHSGYTSNNGGFNDKFNKNQVSILESNGPLPNNSNFTGGIHDEPHKIEKNEDYSRDYHYDTRGNSSRDNFIQTSSDDRGGNVNPSHLCAPRKFIDSSPIPPWKSQNIDNRSNSRQYPNWKSQNCQQDTVSETHDWNDQDSNRRRNQQPVSSSNNISQNQSKQTSQSKQPLKNPLKEEDLVMEKRALEGDVSEEFFNKIKPLSLIQVAADVALRYARKEYYLSKGNNQKVPEKPVGTGQYTCKICYMNFLTKEKLNTHNNGVQHKELEDLFRMKKEQAHLIMQKKIVAPNRPRLEMIQISKAEVENNLKPTEMELDVYILGVYESVMKPYWPLPKSKYYCRVCNYIEFNSESELKRHNLMVDHKKREATYEEAFCLYCQQHYFDKTNLDKHVTTGQHIKIKDLMERTKECAVEHWHKVNNLDIPDKYGIPKSNDSKDRKIDIRVSESPRVGSKRTVSDNDENKSSMNIPDKYGVPKSNDLKDRKIDRVSESPRVGSKRTASDNDENKSPLKKVASSKFDHPAPKGDNESLSKGDNKTDSKKSDKIDHKSSDKKSVERKPKTDLKADSRDSKDKKEDYKSNSKPDSKSATKSDVKPYLKPETKTSLKSDSKPSSKSDSKASQQSNTKELKADNTKTESKSVEKATKTSVDGSNLMELDGNKDKIWFVPIKGFMCIACHAFIPDEAGQKSHGSEKNHIENVVKFKKLINQ